MKGLYQIYKQLIINEELGDVTGYETYYHQTDQKSANSIIKHGFKTPEVWVSPDDTSSYGDVNIIVYVPPIKKPFIMDYDVAQYDYNISRDSVDTNIKYYEQLGGEKNPKTFDKLRELGYDCVIEQNGDRGLLYPKTLKFELA